MSTLRRVLTGIWVEDLRFTAFMNIVMGALMVAVPSERTEGNLYQPARALLEWLPVYPFVVYGLASIGLGVLLLVAAHNPKLLFTALAAGTGYWTFWTILYALGALTGGKSGGLGIIVCLTFSQLRRHLALLPIDLSPNRS